MEAGMAGASATSKSHRSIVLVAVAVASLVAVTVPAARAAGTSSAVISTPYSARSTTTYQCSEGTLTGAAPVCSAPSPFTADSKTGTLTAGTSTHPLTATSPQGGQLPSNGSGAAQTQLLMFHKTTSATSTLTTTFSFTRLASEASFNGAGASAYVAVVGSTATSTIAPVASTVYLNNDVNGVDNGTPNANSVVVTMTAPNGTIPKGTTVTVVIDLLDGVALQSAGTPWTGSGSADGQIRVDKIAFSA